MNSRLTQRDRAKRAKMVARYNAGRKPHTNGIGGNGGGGDNNVSIDDDRDDDSPQNDNDNAEENSENRNSSNIDAAPQKGREGPLGFASKTPLTSKRRTNPTTPKKAKAALLTTPKSSAAAAAPAPQGASAAAAAAAAPAAQTRLPVPASPSSRAHAAAKKRAQAAASKKSLPKTPKTPLRRGVMNANKPLVPDSPASSVASAPLTFGVRNNSSMIAPRTPVRKGVGRPAVPPSPASSAAGTPLMFGGGSSGDDGSSSIRPSASFGAHAATKKRALAVIASKKKPALPTTPTRTTKKGDDVATASALLLPMTPKREGVAAVEDSKAITAEKSTEDSSSSSSDYSKVTAASSEQPPAKTELKPRKPYNAVAVRKTTTALYTPTSLARKKLLKRSGLRATAASSSSSDDSEKSDAKNSESAPAPTLKEPESARQETKVSVAPPKTPASKLAPRGGILHAKKKLAASRMVAASATTTANKKSPSSEKEVAKTSASDSSGASDTGTTTERQSRSVNSRRNRSDHYARIRERAGSRSPGPRKRREETAPAEEDESPFKEPTDVEGTDEIDDGSAAAMPLPETPKREGKDNGRAQPPPSPRDEIVSKLAQKAPASSHANNVANQAESSSSKLSVAKPSSSGHAATMQSKRERFARMKAAVEKPKAQTIPVAAAAAALKDPSPIARMKASAATDNKPEATSDASMAVAKESTPDDVPGAKVAPSRMNEAKTPRASGKTQTKKKNQQLTNERPTKKQPSSSKEKAAPPSPKKKKKKKQSSKFPTSSNKNETTTATTTAAVVIEPAVGETSYQTQRMLYMKMRASMDDPTTPDDEDLALGPPSYSTSTEFSHDDDEESNVFGGVSYSTSEECADDGPSIVSDAVSDPSLTVAGFTTSISSEETDEHSSSDDEEFTHIGSMDESTLAEAAPVAAAVSRQPSSDSEESDEDDAVEPIIVPMKEKKLEDDEEEDEEEVVTTRDVRICAPDPVSVLQVVSSDESSIASAKSGSDDDDTNADEAINNGPSQCQDASEKYAEPPQSDEQSCPSSNSIKTDEEELNVATNDNVEEAGNNEKAMEPPLANTSDDFPAVDAFPNEADEEFQDDEWPDDNFSSASWGNEFSAEDDANSMTSAGRNDDDARKKEKSEEVAAVVVPKQNIPPGGKQQQQRKEQFAIRPPNVDTPLVVDDWEGAKTPTNDDKEGDNAFADNTFHDEPASNDVKEEEEEEDNLIWNASEHLLDLDLSEDDDESNGIDEGNRQEEVFQILSKHNNESKSDKKGNGSKHQQGLAADQEGVIPKSSSSASFEWDDIIEEKENHPTNTTQKLQPTRQRLSSSESHTGSTLDGCGSAQYEGFGSVLDAGKLGSRDSYRECDDDNDDDDDDQFAEQSFDVNTEASEGTVGSATEFDPLSMFGDCEDVAPAIDARYAGKDNNSAIMEKYNPSSSTLTSSYLSTSLGVVHNKGDDSSKSISFPSLNSQTESRNLGVGGQMMNDGNNNRQLLNNCNNNSKAIASLMQQQQPPPPPPPATTANKSSGGLLVPDSPAGTESLESWWQSRYASAQNSDVNSAVQEALMKRSIVPDATNKSSLSPMDNYRASQQLDQEMNNAPAKATSGKLVGHNGSSQPPGPPPPRTRSTPVVMMDEEDSIFGDIDDDMSLPSVHYEKGSAQRIGGMDNKHSSSTSRTERTTNTENNHNNMNNNNRAIARINEMEEDDDESIFSGVSDTQSKLLGEGEGQEQSKLSTSQMDSAFPRLKESAAMKSLLDDRTSMSEPTAEKTPSVKIQQQPTTPVVPHHAYHQQLPVPAPPVTPYQGRDPPSKSNNHNPSSRLFLPDRGYGVINLHQKNVDQHSPTGNSVTSDITSSVIFGGEFRSSDPYNSGSSRRQSSLGMRNSHRPLGILETTDEEGRAHTDHHHHEILEDIKLDPPDTPAISQFDIVSSLKEEPYKGDVIAEAMMNPPAPPPPPPPPSHHPNDEAMMMNSRTPQVLHQEQPSPSSAEQQKQKDLFSANANRGVSLISPSTGDSATHPANPTAAAAANNEIKAPATLLQKVQLLTSAKVAATTAKSKAPTLSGGMVVVATGEEDITMMTEAKASASAQQSDEDPADGKSNPSVAETVNKVKTSFFSQLACGMFAASSFAFCAANEATPLPSPVNNQLIGQDDKDEQKDEQQQQPLEKKQQDGGDNDEPSPTSTTSMGDTCGSNTFDDTKFTEGSDTLDDTRFTVGSEKIDTKGNGTYGSQTIETREHSGDIRRKNKRRGRSRFLTKSNSEDSQRSTDGDDDDDESRSDGCNEKGGSSSYDDTLEDREGSSSIGETLSQTITGDNDDESRSSAASSCSNNDMDTYDYEDSTMYDGSTIISEAISAQEQKKWKDRNHRGVNGRKKNKRRRENKCGGSKSTRSSVLDSKSAMDTRISRDAEANNPADTSTRGDDVATSSSQQPPLPPKEQVQAAQSEAYEKLLMYAYTALSVPAPPKTDILLEKGEEKKERRAENRSAETTKDPTLYPTVLSSHDAGKRFEAMNKILHKLSTEGMEVLKLNREKKWQVRILTITRELTHFKASEDIRFKGIDSCPKGLLWVKKFDPSGRNHTKAAIDKTGKGGMLFDFVRNVSVMKDNHSLSRKQKKGKFKDSITFVLHSTTNVAGQKREVYFRCTNKEDVFALSAGFQAIINRIRNDARTEQIRQVKGKLKKMTIDTNTLHGGGLPPDTFSPKVITKPFSPKVIASPIVEDRWEV